MLDPAFIRDHIETVRQRLSARGVDFAEELEQFATLEAQRRQTIPALEGLKREQNAAGDEVARAKRQGLDATPIFEANKQRAQKIKQLEIELASVEQQRSRLLATIPNIPHESVPIGASAADNAVVRTWASHARSTLSQSLTTTLAPHSAFSTSNGQRRFQARASRS